MVKVTESTLSKNKQTRGKSRGRPARLSREAILNKSLELLSELSYPYDDFTLAKVAKELDTVSMALYNYFPNRESLLDAAADHICMQFKMPKARKGQTWQETLKKWLGAFKKLAAENPIIFKLMGVNGKTSSGWLKITAIVIKTLHEQGLEGKELALTNWWFCSKAIALVQNETVYTSYRSPFSLNHIEDLEPEEQEVLLMIGPYHAQISSKEAMEVGFRDLIAGVESKLQELSSAG